jgi:hypothetical protein
MPRFQPPGQCPGCGEWVTRKQTCCDCCGASADSHWRSTTDAYDGLDLPASDFNYDEFLEKEFGSGRSGPIWQMWWWWVALLLIVVLGLQMFAF